MDLAGTHDSPTRQRVIWGLSLAVCGLVAFLMLGPRPDGVAGAVDVSALPLVNAALNSVTAVLLVAGFVAVRTGRIALHKGLMLGAFGTSALFLLSYVVYHWFSVGPARYEGPFRGAYLLMLLTHVVLAAVILPLALTTLVRGWTGAVAAHRPLARVTLPLWLYVAVTGVLIVWLTHG